MEAVTSPHHTTSMTSIESPQILQTESTSKSRRSVLPVRSGPCLPKVQLVPYAPASFSPSLTDFERELVNNTKFDALDMASSDLEFEDIFTYGKPQQKLARVVEVSLPARRGRKSSKHSGGYCDDVTRARDKIKAPIEGCRKT